MPQLLGSLVGSVQPLAQASSAPGHAQALFWHVVGLAQTAPHLPQLFESLRVSRQLCPHATSGGVHEAWQLAALHTAPAGQALPQPPQF